jgi:hypothetical protein
MVVTPVGMVYPPAAVRYERGNAIKFLLFSVVVVFTSAHVGEPTAVMCVAEAAPVIVLLSVDPVPSLKS